MTDTLRKLSLGIGAGAFAIAMLSTMRPAAGDTPRGFVVSEISYVMAQGAGACPAGLSQTYHNIGDALINRPDLQRRPEETDAVYQRRSGAAMFGSTDNTCMHPERAPDDPTYRVVSAPNVEIAGGINLDGQISRTNTRAAPNTCAHDDFAAADGARGIDNQFFRAMGCTPGFQPSGQSNDLVTEMFTGSWGILITLAGVDDQRNDSSVEVGFYANTDPIQLGGARQAAANASYAASNNPRFRATAHGRIVNGVLTADPVDLRFYSVFNTVRTERPLGAARLRATFTADGALDGYLAGYTPIEAMYDVQIGFRNGTEVDGSPASLQLINTRSIGQAFTIGKYTCQGAYQALQRLADGDRDPATGRCGSISTQYRIRAIPAFVVEANER